MVTVRELRPADWDAARAVCVAAFDGDASIARLLDMLRGSWGWSDTLAFVAVADDSDEVIGLVVFTPCFVDGADRVVPVLVLSPVGVRPDRQRGGVGGALIGAALQQVAATRDEPAVFLEGHPAYYPRFGFRPGLDEGFAKPSPRIPDAAFMVYPLTGYDACPRGPLVYADVFWRADAVGLRG